MTVLELASVICRPRPVRLLVSAVIRAIIPERVTRHGVTVFLNRRDPVISGALALDVYERPETDFFREVLREGMNVVDVGANVGYYSALALGRIGRGRLVAFEPCPEAMRHLKRTIEANACDNAVVIQKAVSDRSGSATLYLNPDNGGDHRLYQNPDCPSSVEIETTTIDEALDSLGIQSVDLLKVDVQGFEGHVLGGMRSVVARSPRLVGILEFWPHGLMAAGTDPLNVLAIVEGWGLSVYELLPRCRLRLIQDHREFVSRLQGIAYKNVVAAAPRSLPPSIEVI